MRFSFPLQTLLNWKRNLEEFSQMRLAAKITRLKNQDEEIQELVLKRLSYEEELNLKIRQGVGADEYSLYQRFAEDSRKDLLNKELQKENTKREVEVERRKMIALSKEKKILERLRDKRFKIFINHLEKLEQKNNDEIVTMKYHLPYK
jgi:flagellar FliJ protein